MSPAARQVGRGILLAVALLAAGCGGAGGPRAALRDAISRIGQIRAGEIRVRFTLAPNTQPTSALGFAIQGSFALNRRLPLPILHVAFMQLIGTESKSTRIDSNGRSATILRGGTSTPLNQQQRQALASTLQGPQGLGGLPLHLDRWVARPHQETGPVLGGQPTDQVSGQVNLSQALGDLDAISRGAVTRAGRARLPSSRLQKALRSSLLIADIGRHDHLLRRLYLRAALTSALNAGASSQGLTITFDLAIDPKPLPSR